MIKNTLNVEMPITLVDGEVKVVTVENMYQIEGIKPNYGDRVGYVTIVYPFAELDLKLNIDMHWDSLDELNDDPSFRIPFVQTKFFIHDVMIAIQNKKADEYHEEEMISDIDGKEMIDPESTCHFCGGEVGYADNTGFFCTDCNRTINV